MTNYDDLPLLLTVSDVQKILRVGRGKAYEMIRAKEVPSIKLGKAIRIPRDSFFRTLEQEITNAEAK